MIGDIPPPLILLPGALLIPFLQGRAARSAFLIVLALFSLVNIIYLPQGEFFLWPFLNYTLVMGRIDGLSLPFGYLFSFLAFIAILFSLQAGRDEQAAGLICVGSALGAVFAGDLLTLFFFWELLALAATFLIWAGRTSSSYGAGLRFLLVQLVGGLILLAGIVTHVHTSGSTALGPLGLTTAASYLILLGFGITAAFPLLHAWLPDAYPASTPTAAVFLSAFTTQTAVYALARSFAGTEILMAIGAVMAAFPLIYALLENDLRRVLSYLLIGQVGFMVVGIGIGTERAINGVVAHAFVQTMAVTLLFMSLGVVLKQTGRSKATDLGGLYRGMPLTAAGCLIGAASLSGVPLLGGFIGTTMITSAVGGGSFSATWLILTFAAAGTFLTGGIKIPLYAFFRHDSGITTKEPPLHMLMAMALAAFFCITPGIFPGLFNHVLPYRVDHDPYTAPLVVNQLQLLFFSALAFIVLHRTKIYPAEVEAINLDADWFYRRGAQGLLWLLNNPLARLGAALRRVAFELTPSRLSRFSQDPVTSITMAAQRLLLLAGGSAKRQALIENRLAEEEALYPHNLKRHWRVAPSATWIVILLFVYLVIYYI